MYLTIFTPKEAEKVLKDKKEIISSFDIGNVLQYTNDPFTTICYLVEDDESPVTIGVIRMVNDFKAIFNPNKSKLKIASALNKMLIESIKHCKKHGSNEVYTMITHGGEKQELFTKYLIKRYGFEKIEGTPLLLEV